MATSGTQNVLKIDKSYLNNLLSQIESILKDVNAQLAGVGNTNKSDVTSEANPVNGTTLNISPVNGSLQVKAGVLGNNGAGFDAANQLNAALGSMGSSVQAELQWLQKVLQAMETETENTEQSFSKTETLNGESVTQLQNDFTNTISTLQQGPQTGSGTSGSTGSGGGGGGGSTSSGGKTGG